MINAMLAGFIKKLLACERVCPFFDCWDCSLIFLVKIGKVLCVFVFHILGIWLVPRGAVSEQYFFASRNIFFQLFSFSYIYQGFQREDFWLAWRK